jgi:tRNA/rRNA methyltransferase
MPQERQEPAFVLVRPQMGENIGAAARAMANFGLSRMRVVGPRDGWPNPKAVVMASGAGGLLDEAMLADDVAGAIADCQLVLATTARPRGLVKDVLTPEVGMALARERIAGGERVAVLFGPERAGLENEDIAAANAIVSVPVDPAFPSLNLAQCVLLMAYEWRRAGLGPVPDEPRETATAGEVQALADNWEGRLDEAGFFFPPDKAEHMKLNLRNLWSRLPLTRTDAQILHGALRQLVRRRPG